MAENKDRSTSITPQHETSKDRAAGNPLQPATDQGLAPPGGVPANSPMSPFAQQPPGQGSSGSQSADASDRQAQTQKGTGTGGSRPSTNNPSPLDEVGPRKSEDLEDARARQPQRSRQKEKTAQDLEDQEDKPNLTQMSLEGQLQSQYQMQGKSPEEARHLARQRAREMCQPDDPRRNRLV
jgi:hypothetical protein